ncbi:glycosyltransferase family 4 protein [bacterium]|nr:glycosyltransferase family 4 protein [bacterium]
MRVLLLNQTFYPDQAATSQQLLDFARHLRDEGCEVTVMASRRAYSDPSKVHPAEEIYDGIRIVRIGSTGFGRRSFFHRFVDGFTFEILLLLRLMFSRRQDLVVAFTSPPLVGLAGLIFTFLRGGKCVQWMMDLNPDISFAVGYLKEKSLVGRTLTAVLRFTVRHSDYIVVLDRWMRQRMVAHGVSSERIVVVPPWPVTAIQAANADHGRRFRERHGLGDVFIVCYSGNHSVVHPLDTVLLSALELRHNPKVLFLFIGGGLRVEDVTRFKQAHQLDNILQMAHQPRETLHESLSAPDLQLVVMGEAMSGLVHTSKIYGVLGAGRPYIFVGPRASHVGDLLDEVPYGFHVEHGDVRRFVEAIERAQALDTAEKADIFNANTGYVEAHCTAEHALAAFLSRVIHPTTEAERPLRAPTAILPGAGQAPSRA